MITPLVKMESRDGEVNLSRKFMQVGVGDNGLTPRHPREERFKTVLETWSYPRE